MTKTENYNLNQWEAADPVRRGDFNADNAAIDAALRAVSDTANGKASAESVAALSQSVAALSSALGTGGQNCRIQFGTYAGTGKGGSANPNKLTVNFYPVAVLMGRTTAISALYWPTILLRPATGGVCDSNGSGITVTWGNNSVQWYGDDASTQNNASSYTYAYIILGYSA